MARETQRSSVGFSLEPGGLKKVLHQMFLETVSVKHLEYLAKSGTEAVKNAMSAGVDVSTI